MRAAVVGIHGGRGHVPLVLVHRFADLGKLAAGFKFIGPQKVAHEIAAHDLKQTIVAPLVGVADFVAYGVELDLGLLLGLLGHPGQGFDVLVERQFQSVHHFQHALLAVSPKGKLNILLSQGFSQCPVRGIHASLPARLDFRLSGERLVHFKVGIDKWLGEPGGGIVQQVPGDIGFQRSERLGLQQAVDLLEKFRVRNVQFRNIRDAHGRQITSQIQVRRQGRSFLPAHLMVARLGIAAQSAVHGGLGQCGFNA